MSDKNDKQKLHYSVNQEKMLIYVDAINLTEEEKAHIKFLLECGYKISPTPKRKVDKEKREERKESTTKLNEIDKYLENWFDEKVIKTIKGNIFKKTVNGKEKTTNFFIIHKWFKAIFENTETEVTEEIKAAALDCNVDYENEKAVIIFGKAAKDLIGKRKTAAEEALKNISDEDEKAKKQAEIDRLKALLK